MSGAVSIAPLIFVVAVIALIVKLKSGRSEVAPPPETWAAPQHLSNTDGEEQMPMAGIDPAQRKYCHGCATPLHVSAQIFPNCGALQQSTSLQGGNGGRKPFPHGWHVVVTVLTMGFWLIPYILIWGFRDKNRYL